jgi:hypothetical protein
MTRKPKTTSRTAKPETAKSQAAKSKTSEIAKPATRRSAAKQPPAPGADDGGEFASPACSAHEVDPAYMMAPTKSAPSKPAPGPVQEKPEVETAPPAPSTAAAPDATAAKAHAPNPSRVPFNQGPKPGWPDRHTKSPHNQGRGRMRVGRPHGRGQGG